MVWQNHKWERLSDRKKKKLMNSTLSGRNHKTELTIQHGFFVFLLVVCVIIISLILTG